MIRWCFCLLALQTVAQVPTPLLPGFTVQNFGAADGLLSPEILSLYQDSKDFIWLGSRSGISRYDGYQFQNFEHAGRERIGAVYNMAEDAEGRLWISTETGLYHWKKKAFVRYAFTTEADFLPFGAIHFTAENEIWLGTARGPVRLPHLQLNVRQNLAGGLLKNWMEVAKIHSDVTAISSSKKGVVFGTYLNAYYYQNNALQKLPNDIKETDLLRNVFTDDAGTVYWNNMTKGFQYWNGKEASVVSANDAFYFDITGRDGEIYVYTNNNVKRIDKKTKTSTNIVDISPLEINTPTRLLVDKEGAYWAGTTEGVYRIQRTGFTVHRDPRSRYTDVYSLLRRPNGELLIGANRGKIFLVGDSIRAYKPLPQVVPLAEVFDMYEDSSGLWAATGYQGIALFKAGKLKNFTTKNGLADNSHHSFYKTSKGALWTAGDNGITCIKKGTEDSFFFRSFFYSGPGPYHKLAGIVEAPDGSLWAGGSLGLFHLQNDSLHVYSLPEMQGEKLTITDIQADGKKNVWLTTQGHGILRCGFGTNGLLHLRRSWQAAEGAENSYLGLAFDRAGNVWAGSYGGLTVIVTAGNRYGIRNFDAKDGFMYKSYQSLRLYTDGDTTWACTTAGAVSFDPKWLLQQPRKAQLYITSIDLLNTNKEATDFLVKGKTDSYVFPAGVNSFSIKFAALYYRNPGAVRYYYRLQGVDSGWTSTGSERNIMFRQLHSGTYTLLLKASIGGSDWTNTAKLFFTVRKPWWLQWWAIASAVALAGGIVWRYVTNRERKLKQEEQRKTDLEKLRAAGYQHQLEIEQVINYFSTSLNGHTTVDGVLWDVARNCISRLGFEDCVIYLKNDAGNMLIQKAAWGPKTTEENKISNPIEIPLGRGIVGTVALTGKAEKVDDTARDSRYIVDDAARASEIAVPIFDEGEVIGVIDSEHSQKVFYTDRHLHILTTIASHCGAKISTLKAEAKTATAKLEALLNKQKALEASLQSMRLQMNPHFLFNALNSIQQMILAGEETTATRFLSKFSKLLRTVLTNSSKEEISLKEEIDLLHLYVELESLRFKEAFQYSIDCDEDIDQAEMFVPALLLQPLVENAIWHGLMHKEGQRHLRIHFRSGSEGQLLCRIEDNGVGRQASSVNGNRQQHTGKGVSVALERLRVLNEKNDTSNSLHITDLKDEEGKAAGTCIDIVLYT